MKYYINVLMLVFITLTSVKNYAGVLDAHSSRLYENREGRYSLIIPPFWQRLSPPEAYAICNFRIKTHKFRMKEDLPEIWGWAMTDQTREQYLATLICHYFSLPVNSGQDSVLQEIVDKYERTYRNVEIVSSLERISTGNFIASRVEIRFCLAANTNERIRQVLYMIHQQNTFYLIIGSAFEKDFAAYKREIENMVLSLQFH